MRVADRQALRLDLMADEGSGPMKGGRHLVYRCSAGYWSLGYGRNVEGRGLSPEEARYLLDNDIAECVADLATCPWFGALDPVRQRALVNMRYQLGPAGFRSFTQMIAALAAGDLVAAARHARDSKWARTDSPARARRVTAMLETGRDA